MSESTNNECFAVEIDLNNDDDKETLKQQPDSVQEFFKSIMSEVANEMLFVINGTESPIEAIMGLALTYEKIKWDGQIFEWLNIINQEQITVSENEKYRVDFLVSASKNGKVRFVVVECDGHDYHERTKQQATTDKRRDRKLLMNGFPVIRITGSEIVEDALFCAKDVLVALLQQFDAPKAGKTAIFSSVNGIG